MQPLKQRLKPPDERHCPYCGKPFRPVRRAQRFDSSSCRSLHWYYTHRSNALQKLR